MSDITSIKLLVGKIEIERKVVVKTDHGRTTNERKSSSTEPAHPDLKAAGDALIPLIEKFIPFENHSVEFKSVSLTDDDNGFAAIYGLYLTPHDENYSGNQWLTGNLIRGSKSGKNDMPEELYIATQALIKEAELFASGEKRAQATLFTPQDEEKTDEQLDAEEQAKISQPRRGKGFKGRFTGGPVAVTH